MRLLKPVRLLLRFVLTFLLGALVVAAIGLAVHVDGLPELSPWHTVDLDSEFTVDSGLETFEEYLALEDRLFAELGEKIRAAVEPEEQLDFNRFHRGSRSDPGRWPTNWNRTIQLPAEAPKAGVVLLHGMSDSPYSLRTQGQCLNDHGAWVVTLRLPGHGTAPSALRRSTWEDMAAAVRLAVDHVAEKVGDRPVHLVGYSNGAALAINHVLEDILSDGRTRISRLVLLSPSIAIRPAAAFAIWQERVGKLTGAGSLEWTSILHEFDPFKYQSFATNAAAQVRRLTLAIAGMFESASDLAEFPPVLAFQSAVDATVSTDAVITGLFRHLPARDHHLVLYDINRTWNAEHLLLDDPKPGLLELLSRAPGTFGIHALVNGEKSGRAVRLRFRQAGKDEIEELDLDLEWPPAVFSLSHVAIPFPGDDPLYGRPGPEPGPLVHLGGLALRGERGLFAVPPAEMLRQRWNPFHEWQQRWMLSFLGL